MVWCGVVWTVPWVSDDKKRWVYDVFAGGTRIEAAKLAGLATIQVLIHIKRVCRTPATTTARAKGRKQSKESAVGDEFGGLPENARRKQIYQALYPETRHDNRSERAKVKAHNEPLPLSFVNDTANRASVSKNTIKRDLQVTTKLVPEVKEAIRALPVADWSATTGDCRATKF